MGHFVVLCESHFSKKKGPTCTLLPLEVCDPCSTWIVDSLPPPRDLWGACGLLLWVGGGAPPQQVDHGGAQMKSKDRS